MNKPLKLLLLEDSVDDAQLLLLQLEQAGFEVQWQRVETEAAFTAGLDSNPDLILADYSLPSYSGIKALELCNARELDIPFILVSGTVGEDTAVTAMKNGAADYLMKDRMGRLGEAVRHALEQKQLRDEKRNAARALRESEDRFRRALENTPFPIQIHAEDGEILSINRAWLEQSGYPQEEVPTIAAWIERAYAGREMDIQKHIQRLYELDASLDEGVDSVRTAGGETRRWHFYSAPLGKMPDGRRMVISLAADVTERERAQAKIERQLKRLSALREIDAAISSNFDLSLNLKILVSHVTAQLGVDAVDILVLPPGSSHLRYGASHGFRTTLAQNPEVRLGESLAGGAALRQETVHVADLKAAPPSHPGLAKLVAEEGFVSYFGLPLISKGQVNGVLEIFQRTLLAPDADWLDFMYTLAGQAAIAIHDALQFQDLQHSNSSLVNAYEATIEGWSRAMDLRDKETEGHTRRVTEMTVQLARAIRLPESSLAQIRRGALLHDIGKMGVPDHILLKQGPLSDDEWVKMREHPQFAYDMLAAVNYLRPALDIPYCHHEKWDGTGYPRGLKGEEIPLAARIFAVVDVWDALTSDRPYRAAWTKDKALAHIQSLAGTHFDPAIVPVFVNLLAAQA